jgi:mycothiol synthase
MNVARPGDAATEPPEGYVIRSARMEDAEAVASLVRRTELHDLGESTVDLGELRSEWQSLPGFDLARDTWVIARRSGGGTSGADPSGGAAAVDDRPPGIVGYAWFQDERDGELLVGEHSVDPEERGRGLQAVLMDRLEDRARSCAARSASGVSQLGVFAVSTHEYKPALFQTRGYRKVREFLRLQLDLAGEPPPPEYPSGIDVRAFRRGNDEAAVHAALNDSFSEHFRDAPLSLAEWEKLCFSNPRLETDLWLVAWDGPEVAGACLSYLYPQRHHGYVDQLGVRRPWRRRGLGTSLLRASFRLLRDRGCMRATLGVDAENVTGAARIYERAGMRPQWRTDFYEKTVRAPLGASPLGARRPQAART